MPEDRSPGDILAEYLSDDPPGGSSQNNETHVENFRRFLVGETLVQAGSTAELQAKPSTQ